MNDGQKDLYQLFRERAEAVSARVIRVAGVSGAAGALADIIKEEKVDKIVADPSGMVEECARILSERGVVRPGSGAPALFFRDLRRHAGDAGLGVSEMALAVAETGSLAGDCTSMESRLVSTLPPVHVALVPSSGIVATPGEALERFYGGGRAPGYLSFISGPSRTADIERVLTIGAHGPEKLYIILVDLVDQIGGGSIE